ncbi:hypothetical protein IWZ01DRAFT_123401 [Phyllosticta capitalensis]
MRHASGTLQPPVQRPRKLFKEFADGCSQWQTKRETNRSGILCLFATELWAVKAERTPPPRRQLALTSDLSCSTRAHGEAAVLLVVRPVVGVCLQPFVSCVRLLVQNQLSGLGRRELTSGQPSQPLETSHFFARFEGNLEVVKVSFLVGLFHETLHQHERCEHSCCHRPRQSRRRSHMSPAKEDRTSLPLHPHKTAMVVRPYGPPVPENLEVVKVLLPVRVVHVVIAHVLVRLDQPRQLAKGQAYRLTRTEQQWSFDHTVH